MRFSNILRNGRVWGLSWWSVPVCAREAALPGGTRPSYDCWQRCFSPGSWEEFCKLPWSHCQQGLASPPFLWKLWPERWSDFSAAVGRWQWKPSQTRPSYFHGPCYAAISRANSSQILQICHRISCVYWWHVGGCFQIVWKLDLGFEMSSWAETALLDPTPAMTRVFLPWSNRRFVSRGFTNKHKSLHPVLINNAFVMDSFYLDRETGFCWSGEVVLAMQPLISFFA